MPLQPSHRAVPVEMWSGDQDTRSCVGFACAIDTMKGIFYAKLQSRPEEEQMDDLLVQGSAAERAVKGAITTLLDVAEACNARKITLGLGPQHAGCAEFICSLLYLGFQVVPSRKSPLVNTALLLDFDIGWPAPGLPTSSDTCTGTSDCSTSAEDDGPLNGQLAESE
mmetsp:Transcript_104944/g.338417  ORF Transcript_104944/g.338417 Transcript_104944/m.338417 type:complete len:167 (+) Transcript_104944:337-837(+)